MRAETKSVCWWRPRKRTAESSQSSYYLVVQKTTWKQTLKKYRTPYDHHFFKTKQTNKTKTKNPKQNKNPLPCQLPSMAALPLFNYLGECCQRISARKSSSVTFRPLKSDPKTGSIHLDAGNQCHIKGHSPNINVSNQVYAWMCMCWVGYLPNQRLSVSSEEGALNPLPRYI